MTNTVQNNNSILNYLQFREPTKQQTEALLGMQQFVGINCIEDFLILSGAAGTGKTSITTALIGYLNSQNINFDICAPTGRAARILGRKSKVASQTVHSLIFNINTDNETGKVKCELKKIKEIATDPKIFIIDEASMIAEKNTDNENDLFQLGNGLLDSLLQYVKNHHAKSKVIFLGDRNQLAPINEADSKALDKEYLQLKYNFKGKEFILSQVKRAQQGGLIMQNAIDTRLAIENNLICPKIKAHQHATNIYNGAANYANNYRLNGADHGIAIGCSHKSNMFFNDLVRERLYNKSVQFLEIGDYLLVTKTYERNGIRLYSGDHVIVKSYDKSKITNVAGFQFMPVELQAKDINGDEIIVQDYMRLDLLKMPQGNTLLELECKLRHERYKTNPVYRDSKNPKDDRYIGALALTYGHAITCNKAQGGEWHTVYVNGFKIPNARWQYTALTIAQEKLVLY